MGKRRLGCLRLSICTSRIRIPNLWINTKKIKVICFKQHHHCNCEAVKEGGRKRRKDKKGVEKRLVGSRKRFKRQKSSPIYRNSPGQMEYYPTPVEENRPPIQVYSNVDPSEPSEEPSLNDSNVGKPFCHLLINLPPRYQLTAMYTKGTVIQVNELISIDEASGEVKFTSDRNQISSLSCTDIDGIALRTPES